MAVSLAPMKSWIRSSKCLIFLKLVGSWIWEVCAASRGRQHSEVNYELVARSRHNQRSPTF